MMKLLSIFSVAVGASALQIQYQGSDNCVDICGDYLRSRAQCEVVCTDLEPSREEYHAYFKSKFGAPLSSFVEGKDGIDSSFVQKWGGFVIKPACDSQGAHNNHIDCYKAKGFGK